MSKPKKKVAWRERKKEREKEKERKKERQRKEEREIIQIQFDISPP